MSFPNIILTDVLDEYVNYNHLEIIILKTINDHLILFTQEHRILITFNITP